MVLDGVVDPVAFTTSTEAQIANGVVGQRSGVRQVPVAVPARGAGALCARRPRAGRRAREPSAGAAAARADSGTIRRPAASAELRRPADRPVRPARQPGSNGRSSPPAWSRPCAVTDRRWRPTSTGKARLSVGAELGGGAPVRGQAAAPAGPAGMADGDRAADPDQPDRRTSARLVAVGAMRFLARRKRRPLHRTVERLDPPPDPRDRHSI